MFQPAFHHRIRRRLAVLLQQVPLERARVHADPHRASIVPGGLDDLLDPTLIADIAGIDPQAGSTRLGGLDAAFVMKMNVRDDGHTDLAHDLPERRRARLVGDADANDVGAGLGRAVDLCDGACDVRRQCVGHRLHGDRRAAADGDVAHHDPAAVTTVDVAPGADRVVRHQGPSSLRLSTIT